MDSRNKPWLRPNQDQTKLGLVEKEDEKTAKYSLEDIRGELPNIPEIMIQAVFNRIKPNETPKNAWERIKREDRDDDDGYR